MGAYKQLLASDIIVTPFEVNKGFTFIGANQLTGSNVGIDRYLGINFPGQFDQDANLQTGQVVSRNCRLVYNSIKELYYSNYFDEQIFGSPINRRVLIPGKDEEGNRFVGAVKTPAYDNYLQSDITYERFLPTASNAVIGVISIPSKLFGDYIQPGSFFLSTESGSYTDDGQGNIITGSDIVGNIIYTHGIVTLTGNYYIYYPTTTLPSTTPISSRYGTAVYSSSAGPTIAIYGNRSLANWGPTLLNAITSSNVTCSFSSSYTIYETQYKCTIRENEFNFTLNPSAISGSYNTGSNAGKLYNALTGSYFDPYITTVGLYDEQQNLLAVGKLSQPLPSSRTTDTTILINIDR